MNKDIVYIDTEDDITAIIGKLKASQEKIVALVPPKRTGVLQSAVNLRLLDRAAKQHDKQIVLITGNQALSTLAAAAKIPVAKNLQSRPEVPEIAALDIDNGEEIIDGSSLPVGDHAATTEHTPAEKARDHAVGTIAVQDAQDVTVERAEVAAAITANTPSNQPSKPGQKIPNFSAFRKRLFLGIGAGVLLIGFLVWAIVFAPRASIIISARLTDAGVSQRVVLSSTAQTSLDATTIRSETKTSEQEISHEFTATGKKDVGEKASGTVKLSQQSLSSRTVAAGTKLTTSGGLSYYTDAAVTIPASTVGSGCFPTACPGSTTVAVTAQSSGTNYNAASGSLSGAPSGVSASFNSATSGGTDKTVTVATEDDIAKALEAAKADIKSDEAKQALTVQFGDTYVVMGESFVAESDKLASNTAADTEVSGAPKITGTVTYRLTAVNKNELDTYLQAAVTKQLVNPSQQQVYEPGASTASFTNVSQQDGKLTASLTATGKTGPKIDQGAVKTAAQGKKLGDIQSEISRINGVESVDVHFSPFWVNKAPNNTEKITVEFTVDG